jgi:hypothetical protein
MGNNNKGNIINLIFSDPNSTEKHFNDDQISALVITNQIVSTFSLVASLLVIIIYWFFKEIRKFIYELAVWLCVSNVFYVITAYFPYNNNKEENVFWCGIQAFMIILFQTAGWIWACIIGYCSFIGVIKKDHLEKHQNKYRILFACLTFILSTGLASM